MSTEEANIKTVLTTLQEILPEEHRTRGKDILPGQHEGNFLIEGIADDGSQITVIFYGGKKGKQTLILIKGINDSFFFKFRHYTFYRNKIRTLFGRR
jgi:hypothetical protein